MEKLKVGIIGGSGLDDPELLTDFMEYDIKETKYGKPSSKITSGSLGPAQVYILSRHGRNHEIPPSQVNYRANIFLLKSFGCRYILATTAVGSLREEIKPENLVFPNQFIDFTKNRKNTFYDQIGEVVHTQMSEPFDKRLRNILCECCNELNFPYNKDTTVITIEGPRFSTKAESYMFRQFGADIINMSTCTEVILANEAGIPYQSIAMSTDYDCWKNNEEPVTWEMVKNRMEKNSEKVKKLLVKGIEKLCLEEEQ